MRTQQSSASQRQRSEEEERAPLSVGDGRDDDGDDADDVDASAAALPPPLDLRVVDAVEKSATATGCEAIEIRPARLAAELGISVDDACAELCGLLSAVGGGGDGGGATFRFEKATAASDDDGDRGGGAKAPPVMVFTFPKDVRRRALRKRRRESMWAAAASALWFSVKALKIVTAFGLILSLFILCVAAIVGMVAAMVALSRTGGGGHGGQQQRAAMVRQIRYLFYTMRQMLWCYAVMGPDGDGDDDDGNARAGSGDPYLREVAFDLSLLFSVCCGNPGSVFYWIRARQLSRRRHRAFRGWGGRSVAAGTADVPDEDGVSLIRRRGSWGNDNDDYSQLRRNSNDTAITADSSRQEHRGLLSVAVEFLFGPVPFYPGPSETERWKLRAAILVERSSSNGISLREMAPYYDSPPKSLDDNARILQEGLRMVSHFNGVPAIGGKDKNLSSEKDARFAFPELMAESSVVTNYGDGICNATGIEDDCDTSWTSFLFATDAMPQRLAPSSNLSNQLPKILNESSYKLTKLHPKQFVHCCLLGFLNLIGVIWLGQSISPGGVLEVDATSLLGMLFQRSLLPVLRFYAVLFFTIPAVRLLLLLILNQRLRHRNILRQLLAKQIEDWVAE